MKTIIAGSRCISEITVVEKAVEDSGFAITEIVSGCAKGVDSLAIDFAEKRGIPIKKFPADWDAYGKAAGMIRNREMAKYAKALIAVWDGESRGTKNMIETAKKIGLKVFVYQYEI